MSNCYGGAAGKAAGAGLAGMLGRRDMSATRFPERLEFPPTSELKDPPATFARARARQNGDLLTRTATWRVANGALVKTGEVLSASVIRERVGYLQSLVVETAQVGVNNLWSGHGLEALLGSKSSFAYRAVESARGKLTPPASVHFDSRAIWLAEEVCGRTLRSCGHQRDIITSLLETGEAPEGTDRVSVRNARRAINKVISARKHAGMKGDATIPTHFFEVRVDAPQFTRPMLPLACTDKQFARIELSEDKAKCRLHLKLPVVARPAAAADWQWHVLLFDIPEDTQRRLTKEGAALCLPNLHATDSRLLARFAVDFPAPANTSIWDEDGLRRVLSLDWGERRLLTATVLEYTSDGLIREVAGPFHFDGRKAQAKMQRQREQAKHLKNLIDRNEVLYKDEPTDAITKRLEILETEAERIWRARDGVQLNLAHHAARWAADLCVETGCREVSIEDLKSLEPRLRGAKLRDRLNHQVRGVLFKHLVDKLAELGIRTVREVFAKNTSACCPRCGAVHRHVKAPDDHSSGRGWAYCPYCPSNIDRDYAGSLGIGSKALSNPKSADLKPVESRAQAQAQAAAKPYKKGVRQAPKLRVARSRHRRDPERIPEARRQQRCSQAIAARNNARRCAAGLEPCSAGRALKTSRSTRQRPMGTDSRLSAVEPTTQPVVGPRSTHCETGMRTLKGFALARARGPRMSNYLHVST
jgi:Putative transposase DNA-binding domain